MATVNQTFLILQASTHTLADKSPRPTFSPKFDKQLCVALIHGQILSSLP